MAIGFTQVPRSALVPFAYIEIEGSRSGAGPLPFRSLLIGQKIAAGAAAENTPARIASADDAKAAFGQGSILHGMAAAFRRVNPLGELWGIAATAGATAQAQTVTLTGAVTTAGVLALYIAGRRISVAVARGAKVADIATAVKDAIAADADLPVTATAAAGVVTVTSRNAGVAGKVNIRTNYYDTDALPAGLAVAIAEATAAVGDADVDDAFDAFGSEAVDVVATAYAEATPIGELETDLNTRWGAASQLDGVAIAALGGTVAAAQTYAGNRDNKYVSVMDASTSPMPPWEWAAVIAGQVALSAEADPALPFSTLPLPGILPPAVADRRTHVERETLLGAGIATHVADAADAVRIERLVTTSNEAAWRDLNAALTLSYLRRSFKARLAKFARFKLANDGTRQRPGQKVLTPSIAQAEAIAWYRDMESRGLVEQGDAFKDGLLVERNADDRNRLDFMLPADLVNQMRIFGVRLAFTQ